MDAKRSLDSLEQSAGEVASRAVEYAYELRSTVSFTSQYVVLRIILENNPLSREEITQLRLWIESHQDRDGCWGFLPKDMSTGDLSITVEAYLALRFLGVGPEELHMKAARQFILNSGGLSKIGVTYQLLLSLLDLVAWSEVPQVPRELMLLPTSGPFFSIFSLVYWA